MATNPPDDNNDDTPDKRPDDSDAQNQQNPFAGTPMEQMFQAFSGGQMPDMNVLMGQMQRMFAPHEGSVNWELATEIARHTVAQSPDPSVTSADSGAVSDAVRLAELWLDQATDRPAGATTAAAWSRGEWIEEASRTGRRGGAGERAGPARGDAPNVAEARRAERRTRRGRAERRRAGRGQADGRPADGFPRSGGRRHVRTADRPSVGRAVDRGALDDRRRPPARA